MTPEPTAIQIVGPAGGETVTVLGSPVRILTAGDPSQMFFADHPVPVGHVVPLHVHCEQDELFYILDGELTLDSLAGSMTAGPGAFVHIPRGAVHGFRNVGDRPVSMVVAVTPGGRLEAMFRDLDAAETEGRLTPEAMADITARHDTMMLAA